MVSFIQCLSASSTQCGNLRDARGTKICWQTTDNGVVCDNGVIRVMDRIVLGCDPDRGWQNVDRDLQREGKVIGGNGDRCWTRLDQGSPMMNSVFR